MRTAFLETEGRLVLTETPMPDIQSDDQVLIRVKTVGVCGSEVHAFHGTHPYRKAPVILGHEAAGDVMSLGEAVTGFKVGDRVIVDPQWTCG
jgi:L-iditol 2-dehydrogenase